MQDRPLPDCPTTPTPAAVEPGAPGADSKPTFLDRPHLRPGYRLRSESTESVYYLVHGGGTIWLNDTAAEIMKRCNGYSTVGAIVRELQALFVGASPAEIETSVRDFIQDACIKGWISLDD